jgi:hypothetical protein
MMMDLDVMVQDFCWLVAFLAICAGGFEKLKLSNNETRTISGCFD